MAWEEWDQLKAQAADRHSTHMQLNQYPADQGGGTQGDLVVGHKDLEEVGKAAHELFDHFTTYSGHARVASEAAAGGLKGEGFALGGRITTAAGVTSPSVAVSPPAVARSCLEG
jgi:hypothetical protein